MKMLARQAMRGSAAMMIAQVIANIASFIMVWAVARGMGDAAYGIFAAAYALATSVASLADSGVRMALIREVARSPMLWHKLWLYAMAISLMLAVVVSLGFIAVILLEEELASQSLRIWLLGYALLWTMMRITLGVSAGHQRLIAVAMWGAFERLASATLILWLVFLEKSTLLDLAQGLLILELIVFALLVIWIFGQHWPYCSGQEEHMTAISFAKTALPFGVSAAAFAILGRLDVIVLGFQQPPDVIGHYAAAQLLAMIGVFIGVSVSSALFPALSQVAKSKDVEQLRRLVRPAMGLLTLIMVCLAMLLSTTSTWLLSYIYGIEYMEGAPWLILFALATPFVAINSMIGAVIGAWGWQGRWAKVLWLLLPVTVIMYGVMGSFFGVWGVALVSVTAQFVMVIIPWTWMNAEGMVDGLWLVRLSGLMLLLALMFWFVPGDLYWLSVPLSIIGVFVLSVCKLSWISKAFRVIR